MPARGFSGLSVREATELRHKDLKAINDKKNPLRVKPVAMKDVSVGAGGVKAVLKPASWNVVRLEV